MTAKPKVAVLYTYPQTVVEDIGRLSKLSVTLSEAKGLPGVGGVVPDPALC